MESVGTSCLDGDKALPELVNQLTQCDTMP